MAARPTKPEPVPGLIDSHCHLDYPPSAEDLEAALRRASAAGVEAVLHIGCSVDRLDPAVELAARKTVEGVEIFASVGIHPHDATSLTPDVEARLEALSGRPNVVAIGETGLDYYYDRSPREVQQEAFARQIALARRLDMPLVLHIREAHQDAWDVLEREPPRDNPGVVHCFTGQPEEAQKWVDLGWHIAFSGIATFKKTEFLRDACRLVPDDRILLETDAPFLAPEPLRGRKNEPSFVAFTCQRLAEARGVTPTALAAQATANTRALFNLPSSAVSEPSAAS